MYPTIREIKQMTTDLKRMQESFLANTGWNRTSHNPARIQLWQKMFTDTVILTLPTDLALACEYAYQAETEKKDRQQNP